ncbi:MAG: 50S ribosomal protein L25 [Candidatus Yanofskybacteria bacterium]|nr:50S ribosomal protein L25 [Candidatus Yanofskybacteria bacterium]
MLSLSVQPRGEGKVQRDNGMIPGVVYGPKRASVSVLVSEKEFAKIYEEAGENSLVSLKLQDEETPILVHEVQLDPLSGRFLHVDFYQPALDEKIEIAIPLAFEGEAPAVLELGGTFLRNIDEVRVRALPQNLPHEIPVQVERLATFEDRILVQDLIVPSDVEIVNDPQETVAQVVPPERVEEELAAPVEENVEQVERIVEEKKVEEEEKE